MRKLAHHHPHLLCTSLFSLFLLLLFIIIPLFFHINIPSSSSPSSSPSSSAQFRHRQLLQQHPSSRRVVLAMEKEARLGSTPPSCYNKCNGCHPCLAVQVPTWPISLRGKRQTHRPSSAAPAEFLDPSPGGGRYSNYKPLGWKCRCRNHLFNP